MFWYSDITVSTWGWILPVGTINDKSMQNRWAQALAKTNGLVNINAIAAYNDGYNEMALRDIKMMGNSNIHICIYLPCLSPHSFDRALSDKLDNDTKYFHSRWHYFMLRRTRSHPRIRVHTKVTPLSPGWRFVTPHSMASVIGVFP